ncbi:MAG: anthranilate phosphoribosyltransferase [Thermodesulfobacteriota bacterium]|nr:anthranilate phosphoribosyltransferase [Thermodesulfobacteriota bacterium]
MNEESLKDFGEKINQILKGKDLPREEAKDMFSQVLLGKQPELHQGAFLSALMAKGPTFEEISGTWEAIYELDTIKVKLETTKPVLDNCGTGMDTIKTFNVSTAAAIVAAAGGVCLARHGARAISSMCGTVDIAEVLGVDVECEIEVVKKSIERTGIGLFNGMSSKVHPRSLFRILSQIRFGTILNLAGSLANPVLPRYGIRGVYSKELIKPVIQVMKNIGYQKAMVFHGLNSEETRGMDEVSPLGETFVAEFNDDEINYYSIFPEDFGMEKRPEERELLAIPDPEKEALKLLSILTGRDKGARYKTICLNTAPIFYLTGQVKNFVEGFEIAKDIIDSGKAMEKLRQWVMEQSRDPKEAGKKIEDLLEYIKN